MTMVREQLKILQTIIAFITINMMNFFSSSKKSAKIFFHYKVMFPYITIPIRIGMFRFIKQNITTNYRPTTLPSPTTFALWLHMGTLMTTISSFVKTTMTTIAFCRKFLTTSFANQFKSIGIFKIPRTVSMFLGSLSNKKMMAIGRTSYSLPRSLGAGWTRISTNNTIIYHNSSLPFISINVKGVLSCQSL